MKTNQYLHQATTKLTEHGIGTARLDVLVLLEDCLQKDRSHILAHPEIRLTDAQQNKLNAQIERRLQHEPLAYIRGKTEFYGREFAVDHRVLEPRPESETMIDLLKKLCGENKEWLRMPSPDNPSDTLRLGTSIADVGSGSGCLGITAALELGLVRVEFYDIDPQTFPVAKTNARRYKIRGQFYQNDLLHNSFGPHEIILANLPYVPDDFHINEAALKEPSIAIFGGSDGLDLYRKLFKQLRDAKWKPKLVLTEALPPQHPELALVASTYGFELHDSEDFVQVFEPL